MSAEHREPSREYVRLTPPPRFTSHKAKAHRGPRLVYPPCVHAEAGRVLTPLGGLVLALALGIASWAVMIGFVWWMVSR